MSAAPDRRPRADADEIIKAARRRARAASSRRRNLIGEAGDGPLTDGSLALQPEAAVAAPVEAPALPETAPEREARPRVRERVRPQAKPAPEPVEMPRPAFVAGVIALVVAGIVGLLLLNTVINEDAYHLQELRGDQAVLDQTEQTLADELNTFNSPNNLEARADEFGMVRPDTVTVLYLPSGETVEMPWSGR
jgi:hypothetical protein